jgi:hypothetical protein
LEELGFELLDALRPVEVEVEVDVTVSVSTSVALLTLL